MTRLVYTKVHALILRSRPLIYLNTDTGRRLISGQTAAALGETFDKKWQFLVAPAGDGWASTTYLVDVPAVVPSAPPQRIQQWPLVPKGYDGIIHLFGPPCKPVCEQGRVTLPAPLPLSWNRSQQIQRFSCHESLAPVFTSVFMEIHRRSYWPLLEDFGGCYNCREQRGLNAKPSTHSWGIGIDLNTIQNPLGTKPNMPVQIIHIFTDHGFTWGGVWSRPDGMHFQYATNY